MDAITLAITAALAELGKNAVKDAYEALKTVLRRKYGAGSELVDAIHKLEEKPGSRTRQRALHQKVINAKADRDQALLQRAGALLEMARQFSETTVSINQKINITGNENIVTGQGNVGGDEQPFRKR